MKIGLEGLSFTQVVLWRLVFGALALVLVSAVSRIGLPRDFRVWKHMAFLAATQCIVPWLLFSWAEQNMSSGLASIYNATTPLMTMAVSLAFLPGGETLTRYKSLGGLLLGFGGGVLIVLAPWNLGVGGSVSSQVACLGATASYGISFVYLRRFVLPLGVDTRTVALLQISIGAFVMVLASPVIANTPMHLTPAIVLSMIALGALGTGLAFIWNTNVVQEWGADCGVHRHLSQSSGGRRSRRNSLERKRWLESAGWCTRGDRGNPGDPTCNPLCHSGGVSNHSVFCSPSQRLIAPQRP